MWKVWLSETNHSDNNFWKLFVVRTWPSSLTFAWFDALSVMLQPIPVTHAARPAVWGARLGVHRPTARRIACQATAVGSGVRRTAHIHHCILKRYTENMEWAALTFDFRCLWIEKSRVKVSCPGSLTNTDDEKDRVSRLMNVSSLEKKPQLVTGETFVDLLSLTFWCTNSIQSNRPECSLTKSKDMQWSASQYLELTVWSNGSGGVRLIRMWQPMNHPAPPLGKVLFTFQEP